MDAIHAVALATPVLANWQMTEARRDLVAVVRKDIKPLVTDAVERTDKRVGESLARIDTALSSVDGVRQDLHGISDSATSLLTSVTATSDQVRADVKKTTPFIIGTVAATKITMGETAQAMAVVRDAAPALAKSAIQNSDNVAGITADIHTVTTQIATPKSFWGKIWEGVKAASGFARFL
jgi:ABC-type transporter Mla subunit MlaD